MTVVACLLVVALGAVTGLWWNERRTARAWRDLWQRAIDGWTTSLNLLDETRRRVAAERARRN